MSIVKTDLICLFIMCYISNYLHIQCVSLQCAVWVVAYAILIMTYVCLSNYNMYYVNNNTGYRNNELFSIYMLWKIPVWQWNVDLLKSKYSYVKFILFITNMCIICARPLKPDLYLTFTFSLHDPYPFNVLMI